MRPRDICSAGSKGHAAHARLHTGLHACVKHQLVAVSRPLQVAKALNYLHSRNVAHMDSESGRLLS